PDTAARVRGGMLATGAVVGGGVGNPPAAGVAVGSGEGKPAAAEGLGVDEPGGVGWTVGRGKPPEAGADFFGGGRSTGRLPVAGNGAEARLAEGGVTSGVAGGDAVAGSLNVISMSSRPFSLPAPSSVMSHSPRTV